MFYREKPYSLTEILLNYLPDDVMMASSAVRMLMNTNVLRMFFPELKSEVGLNKPIDLKCGFNRDYLVQGKLDETKISQILLREDNIVDLNLHFGCGIYYRKTEQRSSKLDDNFEMIIKLFEAISSDPSDKD